MKVLHLTTHLEMGGITIYILRLGKFLRSHGVETLVFSSGGSLEPSFRDEGINLLIKPVRTKNVFHPKLFFQIPYLVRTIQKEKIQLIHAHTRVMQGLAHWVSLFTGVPVVTTCHGFYKPKFGRSLLPAWGRKVIAISHLVREHLEKDMKVPRDKIQMIHNGVDVAAMDAGFHRLSAAEAKQRFGFASEAPVLGIVARLVQDKGHEFALRALKELSVNFPSISLLVVGNGPHRQALEKTAKDLGVDKRVCFAGSVMEVPECLRAMDIFVFPATWREGFGLSIIEAMACRKPVVVTNIWALSLLVRHQETGILIEPRSTQALVEALKPLLEDPSRGSRLGETARNEVLEHFTMERMAREVWDLYRSVAGPRTNPKA